MSKLKYYIKEPVGSYTDENGVVKEVTTIIGEAWMHENGKGFDLCLNKLPQQEMITELDYKGNTRVVLKPVRCKVFPATATKAKADNMSPADVLEQMQTPSSEVIA